MSRPSIGRRDTAHSLEVEKTLDPANEAEGEELRALGHRMVDDILSHLKERRDQPVWRKAPADIREAIGEEPVPHDGMGAAAAYDNFLSDVLPYGVGNTHPRFWGWVMGNGTAVGTLAEMLAAGMNPNVGGFDDSAM